jgi:hypothetical protein
MKVQFLISPRKDKKLMAVFSEDNQIIKRVHFGAIRPDGTPYEDYTTHGNEERKRRYLARHANENWENYMSAGALSRYIFWNKPTISESIKDYQAMFFLD